MDNPPAHPELSILIPVHNAQATLPRTLHSLENIAPANRPSVQILLIDDGSTDQSPAILQQFIASKKFPSVQLLQQPHSGVSAARNAGISAATADWLCLLDADDELNIDPLIPLQQNRQASSVCFTAVLKKNGKTIRRVRPQRISAARHRDVFTANCPIFPSGFCFKRNSLSAPFELRYPYLEDWPFWLSNPNCFADMRVLPEIEGVTIHIHGGNRSSHYESRGAARSEIARDMIASLSASLTPKQLNNLKIQERIGQLQQGASAKLATLLTFPCDPLLYGKLWIYTVLKRRLARLEFYSVRASTSESRAPAPK